MFARRQIFDTRQHHLHVDKSQRDRGTLQPIGA